MEVSAPSRILITGVTGFIGSHLVEQCRALYPDTELFGVCRHSPLRATTLDTQEVRLIEADITDRDQMCHAVAHSRPDWIFHLAAQSSVATSWADPMSTLHLNAGGALRLLEAVWAEHRAARIVLVGSGEQYGLVRPEENPIREEAAFRPINPYGVSKVAQDLYGYQYFAAYRMPILRVRPFNSFGPRQTETFVVADFARQIALIEQGKMKPVITVGNLQAQRDFLPVKSVAWALLAVAQRGEPGQAYNIGSGRTRSISEILEMLLSLSRASIEVLPDPGRYRPIDVPLLVADISRLSAQTGWEPVVDLAYELEETLNYWRAVVA